MIRKSTSLLLGVLLLCAVCPASPKNAPALRMHLPRTVRVRGESLNMGRICVIRGSDAKLCNKVSDIKMGRLPFSGEKITIDRRTILSRLAANGIGPSMIRITGAQKVVVVLDETTFEAAKLIKSAEAFLKKTRPGPDGCSWRLVSRPADLKVMAEDNIRLIPHIGKAKFKRHIEVIVAAVGSKKRELGRAKILFKPVYRVRQAAAIKNITSGETFTKANATVRIISVERKPVGEWTSPFGLVASRDIRAGAVIRPGVMKTPKPTLVIRRNQTVRMKIVGLGFVVTGVGKALSNGRVGELIKVQNTDSKRIVTARVAFDGTVRPIYGKR